MAHGLLPDPLIPTPYLLLTLSTSQGTALGVARVASGCVVERLRGSGEAEKDSQMQLLLPSDKTAQPVQSPPAEGLGRVDRDGPWQGRRPCKGLERVGLGKGWAWLSLRYYRDPGLGPTTVPRSSPWVSMDPVSRLWPVMSPGPSHLPMDLQKQR